MQGDLSQRPCNDILPVVVCKCLSNCQLGAIPLAVVWDCVESCSEVNRRLWHISLSRSNIRCGFRSVGLSNSVMSESPPAGTAAELVFKFAPATRLAPSRKPTFPSGGVCTLVGAPAALTSLMVLLALVRGTVAATASHLAGAEETACTFLAA